MRGIVTIFGTMYICMILYDSEHLKLKLVHTHPLYNAYCTPVSSGRISEKDQIKRMPIANRKKGAPRSFLQGEIILEPHKVSEAKHVLYHTVLCCGIWGLHEVDIAIR